MDKKALILALSASANMELKFEDEVDEPVETDRPDPEVNLREALLEGYVLLFGVRSVGAALSISESALGSSDLGFIESPLTVTDHPVSPVPVRHRKRKKFKARLRGKHKR